VKSYLFPQFILLFTAIVLGAGAFFSKSALADSQGTVTITVKLSVCGNGILEGGEECDGSDLNGLTCIDFGYNGGTLTCNHDCTFNTSNCFRRGGGGGGGGGVYVPPPAETKVVFTGRAYPKSIVTLLKDAQIAATTIADANANFSISLSGLSAGNYIFSLYSEDNKGIRSSLLTFPVSVTAGTTNNIGNIFIAPTIAVDKSEVKRGDNIAIFGQSAPQADIIVSVNSEEEFFGKTISDKDGIYLYNFDSSFVDYGTHYAKSKASIGNQAVSGFSNVISFKVGTKNVFAQPEKIPLKGDLNNDKRVNLIDFSIAAYWYKRPSPPKTVDLNGDGKIDLVDFSILAYYWTG
jgi:hypothetical protein